jgi:ribonuclease D
LGSMLQDYFDIRKERRFQMADWTKRPLSRDKLAYAVKDTLYLIPLRTQLGKELRDKKRFDWALEEFKVIAKTKWTYKEQGFSEVRGFKSMSPRERAITKRLFLFRRRLAKKVDRPAHFVFNTKQLVQWAKHPPSTLHFWKTVKGVHPVVRSYAKVFFNEVKKGMQEGFQIPREKFLRFSQKQKNQMEKLEEHRSNLAEKLKIQKHLILNQDQIKNLVTGKANCLKKWQRDVLHIE